MSEAMADTYAFFPVAVRFAVQMWDVEEERMRADAGRVGHHREGESPAMRDDGERFYLLDRLIRFHFIDFKGWTPEDVELFARLTFPFELLSALAHEGFFPRYLGLLREQWGPTFFYWVSFLWEFTCNACELFADLIYLLPYEHSPAPDVLGRTLFVELVERKVISEYTAVSLIGAVLPYPTAMVAAREHARFVLSLAPALSPAQMGFVIRNILLHFARPEECSCGFAPDESHCTCLFPTGGDSNSATAVASKQYAINCDVRAIRSESTRTYVITLLYIVLNSMQSTHKERHHMHWDTTCRDSLIAATCDVVFSETAYALIYKSTLLNLEYCDNPIPSDGLDLMDDPSIKLERPRPLTKEQRFEGEFRGSDKELSNATLQSGKCLEVSCKQLRKPECANVSCKIHCLESGILACKPHRFMPDPDQIAEIQPRKNVTPRPFHRCYPASQQEIRNSGRGRNYDRPPRTQQEFNDGVHLERRHELIIRDGSEI